MSFVDERGFENRQTSRLVSRCQATTNRVSDTPSSQIISIMLLSPSCYIIMDTRKICATATEQNFFSQGCVFNQKLCENQRQMSNSRSSRVNNFRFFPILFLPKNRRVNASSLTRFLEVLFGMFTSSCVR